MMKYIVVDGGTNCGCAEVESQRGEIITVKFTTGVKLELDVNTVELFPTSDCCEDE